MFAILMAAMAAAMHAPTAQAKTTRYVMTHPMPPHVKPTDPLAVSPGFQIPEEPETFVWKIQPRAKGPGTAQVLVIGTARYPVAVGTIAPGTEISLDESTVIDQVSYYAVPASAVQVSSQRQLSPTARYWVSGLDVKAAARKPAAK